MTGTAADAIAIKLSIWNNHIFNIIHLRSIMPQRYKPGRAHYKAMPVEMICLN